MEKRFFKRLYDSVNYSLNNLYVNNDNNTMSNNKQQTAVDILCGKLAMKLGIPQAITFYIDHQEEIREAKEMHKEEMVMFVLNVIGKYRHGDVLAEVATELYEQTYGGNK
jgi:hypothetical protein